MGTTNYITIKNLAEEMGMDRSNLRKYLKKLNVMTFKVRVPEAGNQLSSAVTIDDARIIRTARKESGYADHPLDNAGWFYVVIPDAIARPGRIKLGFTNSIDNRLKDYKIANPEVILYMKKECQKQWEQAAIYAITNYKYCEHVGGEVYDAWNPYHIDDPLLFIRERCNKFFKFFGDEDGEEI